VCLLAITCVHLRAPIRQVRADKRVCTFSSHQVGLCIAPTPPLQIVPGTRKHAGLFGGASAAAHAEEIEETEGPGCRELGSSPHQGGACACAFVCWRVQAHVHWGTASVRGGLVCSSGTLGGDSSKAFCPKHRLASCCCHEGALSTQKGLPAHLLL